MTKGSLCFMNIQLGDSLEMLRTQSIRPDYFSPGQVKTLLSRHADEGWRTLRHLRCGGLRRKQNQKQSTAQGKSVPPVGPHASNNTMSTLWRYLFCLFPSKYHLMPTCLFILLSPPLERSES